MSKLKTYQVYVETVEDSFSFFSTNKQKEVEDIVNKLSPVARELKVYEKTGDVIYQLIYKNNNRKMGFQGLTNPFFMCARAF